METGQRAVGGTMAAGGVWPIQLCGSRQNCTFRFQKKSCASKNQSLIFVLRKSLNDCRTGDGRVAVVTIPPAWVSQRIRSTPQVRYGTAQLINSRIPWKRCPQTGKLPARGNFIEEYRRATWLPNFHSAEFALRVKDGTPPSRSPCLHDR